MQKRKLVEKGKKKAYKQIISWHKEHSNMVHAATRGMGHGNVVHAATRGMGHGNMVHAAARGMGHGDVVHAAARGKVMQ